MAKIRHFGVGGSGQHIEAYQPQDPYYHSVDNRPLVNLTDNDVNINNEIQSMIPKNVIETPDGQTFLFTLPDGEQAVTGSLNVILNGIHYNPNNIEILNQGHQFRIVNGDVLPEANDNFYVVYRKATNKVFANSTEFLEQVEETEGTIIQNVGDGDNSTQLFYGVLASIPEEGSLYISNDIDAIESGQETGNIIEVFYEVSGGVDLSGESGFESGEEAVLLESDEGGTGWLNRSTGYFEVIFATVPESGQTIQAQFKVQMLEY